MFKIESLKNYLAQNEEFIMLAKEIYQLNSNNDYQEFKKWYLTKQIPGIFKNERDIFFVRNANKQIIAMVCLKRTNYEKKICSIFVDIKYRKQGIGTMLIEESLKWLGTTKPLITFPDYKLDMFKGFIEKYNWQLVSTIDFLYNDYYKELCFNETLFNKQELDERLIKVLKYRITKLNENKNI